jgi:hypothetical protein
MPLMLGCGAGLELLIGYTRLGNLLGLLDREEVRDSAAFGVGGTSCKLVRFVPLPARQQLAASRTASADRLKTSPQPEARGALRPRHR